MKLGVLVSMVLIQFIGQCQTVYFEDFDSGSPDILDLIDNDGLVNSGGATQTWEYSPRIRGFGNASMIASSNFALRSITDPSPAVLGQQSEDWIMLPQLTIPANGLLMFKFQAESDVSPWEGYPNLEVRVSTTDTSLSSYTSIQTISDGPSWFTNQTCDLSAYAGQSVYVAIVNSAYNNPGWGSKRIFIDDIFVGALNNYDCAAYQFYQQSYAEENTPEQFNINALNMGSTAITSVDVNYSLDGGATETANITGLSINTLDSFAVVHPTSWTPILGSHTVEIWLSNINGNADQNNVNDTISYSYEVFSKVTAKKPLLEIFGGSNCSACAPLARDMDIFTEAWNFNDYLGHISHIDYQSFTNEPSDNADAQLRDSFYSVSGYPDEQISDISDFKDIFLDDFNKTFQPFLDYDNSPISVTPSFLEMTISASQVWDELSVDVTINPLKDINSTSLKMYIAVCEHSYNYTGGFTSQTEFKHVMRKMLPDGNGTVLASLLEGVSVNHSESYTFTTGNVSAGSYNLWEGMHNLEIVAFVQDTVTEEVLQSASIRSDNINSIETVAPDETTIYPNPSSGIAYINLGNRYYNSLQVINITGKILYELNGLENQRQIRLDLSNYASGAYLINMISDNGYKTCKKLILNREF